MAKVYINFRLLQFLFVLTASQTSFGQSSDTEEEAVLDTDTLADSAATPPPNKYAEWADWEAWTPSPEVMKAFPYYRMGYDNDGVVAYVAEFGKWDYRQWPVERIDEFWKHFEQMVRYHERDAKLSGGHGVVSIVDFDGFELTHHASASALRLALAMFSSFNRLNNSMKYGFYLNVNFAAETFINLSRPFLGDMLNRYEIFGTRIEKWKPLLLAKIPADQVPPKYGGTNSYWKPLPLK